MSGITKGWMSEPSSHCIFMAYVVMAYIVRPIWLWPVIVIAYVVIAYVVMAYIVRPIWLRPMKIIAYVVMAYMLMAYISGITKWIDERGFKLLTKFKCVCLGTRLDLLLRHVLRHVLRNGFRRVFSPVFRHVLRHVLRDVCRHVLSCDAERCDADVCMYGDRCDANTS